MEPDLEARLELLRRHEPRILPSESRRAAAVLIPILAEERGRLLFTLRSRSLKHHPGQISFPGGAIEPDEDPWEAALREAQEEIGLAPEGVRFLGRLDDVFSPRGFHIHCFVGLVPRFEPLINAREVEKIISVEPRELFESQRHEVRDYLGRRVHYFHFDQGLVWGVTGQITHHLIQVLAKEV